MKRASSFKSQYPLLEKINTPKDIRSLSPQLLEELASEIRSVIIDTVSRTGGHLASNLGVVELTIALHYAFDTPDDRLIWDVGHQVYTHKLLTGRLDSFQKGLRMYGGLSGFPKKDESAYDHYDTGHSGTSISFALGMAESMRVRESSNHVVAIIGDGSMTSGISFEALNHAGQLKNEKLFVVLNDNEMSISPNVGALSEYISRRMVSPRPAQIRRTVKGILQSIPRAGQDLVRLAQKVERSIKDLVQPGLIFEELGFQYAGPFDGHNIDGLIEIFKNIRNLPGPMLLHVLTKKGHGYQPAESEPERFHGASAFDIKTGVFKEKAGPPSYTSVFGQAVTDLARKNKRIIAITAAMTLGTGLNGFAGEFPDRFYDVGIAEQHAVAFAAGCVQEGLIPVVAIYSTFLQRAYDQVFHDVCLQKLPVIFAIDRAGLVGADGPTHHGVYDFSYLRHLPGMIIISPRDENELRRAIFAAPGMKSPVAIRYPRGNGIGVEIEEVPRPLDPGEGEIMKEGSDVTLLAIGPILQDGMSIAEELDKTGLSVEVIDARFVKPIDSARILTSIRKTGRLMILEENALMGGFSSAVLESLTGHPIRLELIDRMGIPDTFVGMGSQDQLREEIGLSRQEIKRRLILLASKKYQESNHESHPGRSVIDSSRKGE